MKTSQIRLLSCVIALNLVICTAVTGTIRAQSTASDLEVEERVFLAMIDKGHNKGYEAYQTPAGLQQFMIQFWTGGKYQLVIAEADKIIQKYPNELHYRVNALKNKHKALLALGKEVEAARLYDDVKDDHRRCSVGYRTSLSLFVKVLMAKNVVEFRRAALDYDGAIRALEDKRCVNQEVQKDCDPGWADAAEYYAGADIDLELGDIYRLWHRRDRLTSARNVWFV